AAGRPNDALVGGQGTLATDKPLKTVGSYWPYATTLFDYIRRAMPLPQSKSLTPDEVYALAAFILAQNKIIGEDDVMDAKTLPQVKMPNRDGFVRFERGK
ncbi:MAG TPA: cytochrome c, partial [Xanthobacteraceae bacterium]